ncbi:TB2/DP1, HVA22 family-domain-containing protein [Schizophyllum amplum]|uniref:Protein YOP1 n=1 Tax=Schizophyllum amplum TaxID=97359 RepID=A0A550CQ15_9AGAR|nr:TB2/DP1, HVA22 family-domain-containing protein [Auriculariopsis ampla]
MLLFLTSRIISAVAAFLYPGYASYKTLSQRPAVEEELERWLMYWSVLGCIVATEYVAEWLISWIPFYYGIKTIFLLYLSLPQTRGSSYLYEQHLQPFFHNHERQIDAAIASFRSRVYAFAQERVRALWSQVAVAMGQPPPQDQLNEAPTSGASTGATPTLSDPVSGPAALVGSLWRSYGPGIVASGAALLSQANRPPAPAPTRPPAAPAAARAAGSSQSVLERRRQLEAELAALQAQQDEYVPSALTPGAGSSYTSSPGSEGHMRERTTSMSKFEEVEVPSDVEGYDVGGGEDGTGQPMQRRSSSWFGWGGANAAGYERVKSE